MGTTIDDQRQEPGSKRVAPGVYVLAEFLNSSRQANLFRSLQTVSAQMRYNPGIMPPMTASLSTALSSSSSIWSTPGVVAPDEHLVPNRLMNRHQIEQLVLLNTWKDDDLPIPFEWVDVCDKAADLVPDLLSPFFPAFIESNLCLRHDPTRFRSDARRPGWRIWASFGCTAKVAIRSMAATMTTLDLMSGDALVLNTSPKFDLDVEIVSLVPDTCPPALLSLEARLRYGRCNLVLAEDARYERLRPYERALRRTFEIQRKKLWKRQAPSVQ